jgi:site-specific recombinase XerD
MGTVSWTAGTGPLAPFADGFRQELLGLDHPPESVKHYLVLMGQLDGWLMVEGREVVELTAAVAEEFLVTRRARGQRRVPTLASLVPLFEYLKKQGAVRAEEPKPPTAREVLLAGYHHHLVHERGLTPSTVVRYERFARRFLAQRALRTGTDIGTEKLASPEISAFMLETGSRLVVESAKREAADLRSLLRFFYLRGVLETDLGTAMPPVATWRGTRLPPSLSAAHVDALLASCDRSTVSGRRDYAVLALLARLGLRSGEVAALQLGDVDWRAGEVAVRGKARRQDRLPLPVEVGEALADYLRRGRPRSGCRQVILTLYAPFRPIHPSSITNIVYRACRRAGMPRVGGHRLRHALATEMLRRGGNLMEIAQVLRQSDPGTTSGYAKVDRIALRAVAQFWPEWRDERACPAGRTVSASAPRVGPSARRRPPVVAPFRGIPGLARRLEDHRRGRSGLGATSRR